MEDKKMENKIIKLGTVDFFENEIMDLYFNQDKKFITTFRKIYQVHYSNNMGFYASLIYTQEKNKLPLMKKRSFYDNKSKRSKSFIK